MPKRRELAVTLVSSGIIIPHLHYGPVARNWWFIPSIEIIENNIGAQLMYPIRVGMKTQVELNGKKFILRVLEGNTIDTSNPGYSCQCELFSSDVEESSTKAISSLYQKIFQNSTKISGSLV